MATKEPKKKKYKKRKLSPGAIASIVIVCVLLAVGLACGIWSLFTRYSIFQILSWGSTGVGIVGAVIVGLAYLKQKLRKQGGYE